MTNEWGRVNAKQRWGGKKGTGLEVNVLTFPTYLGVPVAHPGGLLTSTFYFERDGCLPQDLLLAVASQKLFRGARAGMQNHFVE